MPALSCRRRDRLRAEITGLYGLWQEHGTAALGAALTLATEIGAYGVEYLMALLHPPGGARPDQPPGTVLAVPGVPAQSDVDRCLSEYEAYVAGAGVAG